MKTYDPIKLDALLIDAGYSRIAIEVAGVISYTTYRGEEGQQVIMRSISLSESHKEATIFVQRPTIDAC